MVTQEDVEKVMSMLASRGGLARAKKLTKARRQEISRMGGAATKGVAKGKKK